MSTETQTRRPAQTDAMPTPERFFESIQSYLRTAALKAAIELDLFTAIAGGAQTVDTIARRCGASERGIRILCDYLTVIEFLTKNGQTYQVTPDSMVFLSKHSPAYMGNIAQFLAEPRVTRRFETLAETVRRGTVPDEGNMVADENPLWVDFARAMVPLMAVPAQGIADLLGVKTAGPIRVLDIAAGHGIFGITLAQQNPAAEVVAVDWTPVLAVAVENATKMSVGDRYRTVAGDAFKVEFGTEYDIALITNFLHHFDPPTCVTFLRKVAGSMKIGGRVVLLEFVPNDDRVSPSVAASFSLTMLGTTPAGDAYTFAEHSQMLTDAGFHDITRHQLPTPETVLVAVG